MLKNSLKKRSNLLMIVGIETIKKWQAENLACRGIMSWLEKQYKSMEHCQELSFAE